MGSLWRRCNTCKAEIGHSAPHYVCSVSTCHRKGTDFVFCSVECWEAHVPLFRHRDAWAEERRSPPAAGARSAPPPGRAPEAGAANENVSGRGTDTGVVHAAPPRPPAAATERPPLELRARDEIPEDILVVASKLKAYVRSRSGMNTSDGVLPRLSRILRDLCDDAIERAHADGRKTVMDRDLP